MATTQTPTYAQVRDMVYALSFEDILRLKDDLENSWMKQRTPHPYCSPFGPATKEEAITRVAEAMADFEAGRYVDAETFDRELEEKYPWLSE